MPILPFFSFFYAAVSSQVVWMDIHYAERRKSGRGERLRKVERRRVAVAKEKSCIAGFFLSWSSSYFSWGVFCKGGKKERAMDVSHFRSLVLIPDF
jgi:hypothetical protein